MSSNKAERHRVGVKDVAREAGVSLGTVSNVLNRPERVAEATREHVLAVIDSLGYVRAEGAKQLRGWAARILALTVPDVVNPFYASLAVGVQQAADEARLSLMVCTGAQSPAVIARHLSLMSSHQIRGAVVASAGEVGKTVAAYRRNAIPFVIVDQNAPQPSACSVGSDDVAGGRSALRHLIEQGHREIVYVSGPDRLQQVRDRYRGALSAVRESAFLGVRLRKIPCSGLTVAAGIDAAVHVLGLSVRPTAVFCANDLVALGVMQALDEAGLQVPDDIALVGYDDIDFAATARVPLTSVRQPARAMGLKAGHLLLADTALGTAHVHGHTGMQPELVVRRSSLRKTSQQPNHERS